MFGLDNTSHTVIEQSNAATNPYFVNTSFPTGTKVSRGGFMRCPFRAMRRTLCF